METKKRLFFPLLVLCVGIILCVSLASVFFSLSRTKRTNDAMASFSSIDYSIYFLSVNKSQIEAEAVQMGKDKMQDGYAGYTIKSGDFHVIYSAYKNENDATLVKNKLEKDGICSEIIKFSFPAIKISSDYSSKEREVLSAALNAFHDSYSALYDISISLDGGFFNETSASLMVNQNLSNFIAIKNNFDTLFSSASEDFISTIKHYLTDMHEVLSLLSNKTLIVPTQTYSSLIKYRYCEILDLNFNMIIELNTSKI